MSKCLLKKALTTWCDENLTEGKAYRGSIDAGIPIAGTADPDEQSNRKGVLTYQDGTACSSSHAFADVYLLDDGSYDVYMDSSHGEYQGDSGVFGFISEVRHCKQLSQVVDYLSEYSVYYSQNSCGTLIEAIAKSVGKSIVLSKIDDSDDLEQICMLITVREVLSNLLTGTVIESHIGWRNEK